MPSSHARRTQRRAVLGRLGACAFGLLSAQFAAATDAGSRADGTTALPRLDDLRQLAAQARRERVPILLFFSTAGCPFCLQARRDYLGPLHARGAAAGVLMREIEITGARSLADLDSRPLKESAFADRYKVRMVPHVELVDADLKPLVKPLVGIDAAGFYGDYLKDAIDAATRILAARGAGPR